MNKEKLKSRLCEALGVKNLRATEFNVNGKVVSGDVAWRDYVAVTHMACLLTQLEKQVELLTNHNVLNLAYTPDGKKFVAALKKVDAACKNAHEHAASLNKLMAGQFKDLTHDVWNAAHQNMKDYSARL